VDERGQSSFQLLQQRFHLTRAAEVESRMKRHPAYVYLFDILYIDQYDVTSLPLTRRKGILKETFQWSNHVRWTDGRSGRGKEYWQEACKEGSEGIVGKKQDSPYVHDRSPWWVKIKCIGRQEFVICGFTEPRRSRIGLGALLVGYYNEDSKHLVYAGKVGTGYTQDVLRDLRSRLDDLSVPHAPFDEGDLPRGEQVHWVKPELVAEIAFSEWTQNGLVRQPPFEGLRTDKKPKECRREQPKGARG